MKSGVLESGVLESGIELKGAKSGLRSERQRRLPMDGIRPCIGSEDERSFGVQSKGVLLKSAKKSYSSFFAISICS